MGWSLSPYYFVTLTQVFITHLRKPEPEPLSSSTQPTRSKRYLRRTKWRGARILPYADDFLLFSASMEQALHLRQRLASLLDAMELQRNPTKGFWEPCQFGMHLGVDIDSASGMFYAPADKLNRLFLHATRFIGRATRNARWLPVRELQSLAEQAQYLFLAIPAARFFPRELHSVVGDRWGGRVRMTPQLRRDLQSWTSVPSQSTGKPIHRPVETAYMHTDNSGYGWGGVLNGRLEARGFWSSADERHHITWKELKAVRLAVESFIAYLAGRNVLLHEDNHAPYLSAINNFFKDHGREPMALGDLVSKVCKGLAASQVTLNPELMRAPLPARVVLKALTLAKALRLELGPTWGTDPRSARTAESSHRDRKGQRGADARKKLLCQLPASSHADIAELQHYFDAARQVFAGGRLPAARWAISQREGRQAKWTADTLTIWLQLGATTAACVIGVTMQKIKYFGG
eukprot:jgi/Tetstr1/435216/TSEL_024135.t1